MSCAIIWICFTWMPKMYIFQNYFCVFLWPKPIIFTSWKTIFFSYLLMYHEVTIYTHQPQIFEPNKTVWYAFKTRRGQHLGHMTILQYPKHEMMSCFSNINISARPNGGSSFLWLGRCSTLFRRRFVFHCFIRIKHFLWPEKCTTPTPEFHQTGQPYKKKKKKIGAMMGHLSTTAQLCDSGH